MGNVKHKSSEHKYKRGRNVKSVDRIINEYTLGDVTYVVRPNGIYVIRNDTGDLSDSAITIYPGFQVALGTDIREVVKLLQQTRLPLIIERMAENDNVRLFGIVRIGTGNVKNKRIAAIKTSNNMIKHIAFNRKLIHDAEYRQYVKLSVYHQLALSCEDNKVPIEQKVAFTLLNVLPYAQDSRFTLSSDENVLTIVAALDFEALRFEFAKNEEKKIYELSDVSLSTKFRAKDGKLIPITNTEG